MQHRGRFTIVVVGVLSAFGSPAWAAPYQYTRIADYPARPAQFLQSPPINARGQVAFMPPDDQSAQGVSGLVLFRSPSPPVTLVGDEFADARSHSLDNTGRAVYVQEAVFLTDGVNTQVIADIPDDPETEYYNPVLNEHGTVAFAADQDEDGNTAIYVRRPGEDLLVISDGMVDPLDYHSAPALDESDRIVFSAYSFDTLTTDVYLYDGVKISLIQEHGVAPSVSRGGVVAFTRLESSGGASSVLRSDENAGSPLALIADSSGDFTRVLADDVNDAGLVVFRGSLPNGDIALCVGDGQTVQRVAQTWQVIGGKKVANVSRGSINNHGQIAFEVTFIDGSAAVLRATPVLHASPAISE